MHGYHAARSQHVTVTSTLSAVSIPPKESLYRSILVAAAVTADYLNSNCEHRRARLDQLTGFAHTHPKNNPQRQTDCDSND